LEKISPADLAVRYFFLPLEIFECTVVYVYHETCSQEMEIPLLQDLDSGKYLLFMGRVVSLCINIFGGVKGYWLGGFPGVPYA